MNVLVHLSVCSYVVMECKTKLHEAKPWLKHTKLLSQSVLKRLWIRNIYTHLCYKDLYCFYNLIVAKGSKVSFTLHFISSMCSAVRVIYISAEYTP